MDETCRIKAIILKREAFRENDTRVVVYSREKGRLDLVARGTKKIKSKMAGHLEPITLANLMVVRGRAYDLIGSAVAEDSFIKIKEDLNKIDAAGQAFNIFLNLVKPEEADEKIFSLLLDFLDTLNIKKFDSKLLSSFFSLKLIDALGYRPELKICVFCKEKIKPRGNMIDFHKGGLVCLNCIRPEGEKREFSVSDDVIKVLRLVLNDDFDKLIKLNISKKISAETINIISSFLLFHHGI